MQQEIIKIGTLVLSELSDPVLGIVSRFENDGVHYGYFIEWCDGLFSREEYQLEHVKEYIESLNKYLEMNR